MPVLLSAVKTSDDPLRLYLLKSLTELVSVLRQHVRKYLSDLLDLVHYYWTSEKLLPVLLMLVSEIAGTRHWHTHGAEQCCSVRQSGRLENSLPCHLNESS